MLTDELDVVIGVDTHADTHALALVQVGSGALLAECRVSCDRAGYRKALRFAAACRGRRLWALEGSGCYGAGLARFLRERGERLVEVERPARQGRRGRCKQDSLDALRAARTLLSGEAQADPRRGETREALRVLLSARQAAVATRASGLNQLRALTVSAPESVRRRLHGLSKGRLVASCLRLRPGQAGTIELRCTLQALRLGARRVQAATSEAAELERELSQLVSGLAPWLLDLPGVGPISAAEVLVAWSHRGRLRSEAAFARLAGTAPIPASSGKRVRHRLDRGGDRRLNRALHTIVLCRRRTDPATIAYLQRRLSEGKSTREAVRCLKRYLARSLFRLLERTPMAA
jgi:transposase